MRGGVRHFLANDSFFIPASCYHFSLHFDIQHHLKNIPMSDPLKHPCAELEASARSMSAMRNSKSMEEFEAAWRDFLNHIEKVYVKVERCCQPFQNKFLPWQGRYNNLRKKDALLRYIKQARDADNHSIQDITEMIDGKTTMKFANQAGGYIENLEIHNGKIVHYSGDPMIVEHQPPQPIAVPVKNNSEWYNPPTSHLEKRIDSKHPLHLADLAFQFYSQFVDATREKFFVASKP